METAEQIAVKKTAKTERQLAFEQQIANASQFVKNVNLVNLMKAAGKGLKANIEVDKFLSRDFERLVPVAFRPDKFKEQLDALFLPKKHEHHGVVNLDAMKAILGAMTADMVAVEVAERRAWLGSFNLDEEQQKAAAETLTRYERHLNGLLNTSIKAWKAQYGVE